MTQHLQGLNEGDESLSFSPPTGTFDFTWIKKKAKTPSQPVFGSQNRPEVKVGMIAAGTGITPMIGIMERILDPGCQFYGAVTLLYYNREETDILLKERLEEWQREFSGQFYVAHSLTQPPEDWKGLQGLVLYWFFIGDNHRIYNQNHNKNR